MPPNYSFSLSKEMTENGLFLSFFFTGFEMKGFFFLFNTNEIFFLKKISTSFFGFLVGQGCSLRFRFMNFIVSLICCLVSEKREGNGRKKVSGIEY